MGSTHLQHKRRCLCSRLMLIQFHSHGTTTENGPQLDNYSLIPSNLFINLIDETTNYWKRRMKKTKKNNKTKCFSH